MSQIIRIISDIHYGDRASAAHHLEQLAPLAEGNIRLICNGDATDTRPEPNPDAVPERLAQLHRFATHFATPWEFVTGNHDPDISETHFLDLAEGEVLITHGDILFHDIVPWGQDALLADQLVQRFQQELKSSHPAFNDLLIAHRLAARDIPQRHQAEKHGLKYLAGFLTDTIWPPSRIIRILRAWREFPARGHKIMEAHRPGARFLICGHTHRPGIWHRPDGRILINTGSFCPPSGQLMVELNREQLLVRRIKRNRRDYHPGKIMAHFPLTPASASDTPTP